MKKRLIILSDLWGKQKASWIKEYTELLEDRYEVTFYDSCEFAEIDTRVYEERQLHRQFVNGGIELAVKNLLKLEGRKPISILAFSVGGIIAWKYSFENNNVRLLYCVSSTRLRYEKNKPLIKIRLVFGNEDKYIPDRKWLVEKGMNPLLLKGNHSLYIEKEVVKIVSEELLGF